MSECKLALHNVFFENVLLINSLHNSRNLFRPGCELIDTYKSNYGDFPTTKISPNQKNKNSIMFSGVSKKEKKDHMNIHNLKTHLFTSRRSLQLIKTMTWAKSHSANLGPVISFQGFCLAVILFKRFFFFSAAGEHTPVGCFS